MTKTDQDKQIKKKQVKKKKIIQRAEGTKKGGKEIISKIFKETQKVLHL